MFKQKRQEKFLKKRGKALQRHLRTFFKSMDPEEIHQVRVEIKKIKALVTFLRDYSGQKKISNSFKPVEKIFKRAGLVRTANVNLQLIKKYHLANEKLKNEQNKNLVYQVGKFCERRDDYLAAIEKASKNISGNFRNIHTKFVLKVYRKKQKKLSQLFSTATSGKWHASRKKIKFLLYLYKMLPKSIIGKMQINTNYLHLVEESIGKWHDTVLAIELLKRKNYSDKATLNRLETQAKRASQVVRIKLSDFSLKAHRKSS